MMREEAKFGKTAIKTCKMQDIPLLSKVGISAACTRQTRGWMRIYSQKALLEAGGAQWGRRERFAEIVMQLH
jgi:hypothetical protein